MNSFLCPPSWLQGTESLEVKPRWGRGLLYAVSDVTTVDLLILVTHSREKLHANEVRDRSYLWSAASVGEIRTGKAEPSSGLLTTCRVF